MDVYNVQYHSNVSYQSQLISCVTRIASCTTLSYPLVSSGQISETYLCNIVEFPCCTYMYMVTMLQAVDNVE